MIVSNKKQTTRYSPFRSRGCTGGWQSTQLPECYTPPTAVARQTASTISSSPTAACRPLGMEREGRGKTLQRRHRTRPPGITLESLCVYVCFQQTCWLYRGAIQCVEVSRFDVACTLKFSMEVSLLIANFELFIKYTAILL